MLECIKSIGEGGDQIKKMFEDCISNVEEGYNKTHVMIKAIMLNNHKIVKHIVDVMVVMVHSWEQQERAIVTIGDETNVTWVEEGPNKRTHGNMKNKEVI